MDLLAEAGGSSRSGGLGPLLALALAFVAPLTGQGPIALAVPGRANANASIAADGDTVVVVWAASAPSATIGATDAFAAISRDRGRTFGPPVRVNEGDGDVRASGEQPPRVAVREAGRSGPPRDIVVSWVSTRDGATIRFARSADGGRTFSASRAVSPPGAPGTRGWHAMTIDARGTVEIVWLDHRDMAPSPTRSAAAVHGARDGAMMAQQSGLYLARVTAGGVQPEQRVTTGVCYCCKTAVAAPRDGSILAAWRHVYPGNIRDIALARAPDGRTFSAPVRVSADQWQLHGCPDDGPAIAVDAANRTHVVWPTLEQTGGHDGDATMSLFYAMSIDGTSFTPRARLPTGGAAHHPHVAIARDGSLAVVWDESADGTRHVALARGVADGAGGVRFIREAIGGQGAELYPVVAATADALVAAWTARTADTSVIRVARIVGASAGATHSR